jgi:hypothetical protein
VKIAIGIYKPVHNVILSEAKNLRSEMFRFAQHDNAIDWIKPNHAW